MSVFLKPVLRMQTVTVRTHARIVRDVLKESMVDHLEHRMPGHFEQGAERKYNYRKRSSKYLKRKLRKVGHQIPLVYTGRTKRDLIASKHRITGTQHKARLYYRNYFPLKNDQRIEIEKVLLSEVRDIAKFVARRYAQECRKPHNQIKRRRG